MTFGGSLPNDLAGVLERLAPTRPRPPQITQFTRSHRETMKNEASCLRKD